MALPNNQSHLDKYRKAATWLLRLESLILFGLVLYLGIAALTSTVSAPGALIGEMIFGLLGSVGLFICAREFAKASARGRAPAVLANLIALGVSYFMITGKLLVVGIPLAILALVTFLAALFGYRE
jgi:hypothetical protein